MKKPTKIFNMRMPSELYDYIKDMSINKYTTMTSYVLQLIVNDMEKQYEKVQKMITGVK